jgi:hypothetical protein
VAVAASTVGSGDIKNNSIRQHDIADGAVGSGEIINNTIRRHDIADGSVGPGEILDGSVRFKSSSPNRPVMRSKATPPCRSTRPDGASRASTPARDRSLSGRG